jgi:hypothetical protein
MISIVSAQTLKSFLERTLSHSLNAMFVTVPYASFHLSVVVRCPHIVVNGAHIYVESNFFLSRLISNASRNFIEYNKN